MLPFKKEDKPVPANFAHTDMSPCKSRGRFKPYIYFAEFLISIYAITLQGPGLVFGSIFAIHALYRLCNAQRFQAACPHCQTVRKGLVKNGRPFTCKSCAHRLGIYGTKLADLGNAGASDATADKGVPTQAANALGALVFIGVLIWLFGGGLDWQAGETMKKIQNNVAADAVAEYGIAQRNGNNIDQCVQAGIVAAAYLQANDEKNYAHWKGMRDRDCGEAGIPPQ